MAESAGDPGGCGPRPWPPSRRQRSVGIIAEDPEARPARDGLRHRPWLRGAPVRSDVATDSAALLPAELPVPEFSDPPLAFLEEPGNFRGDSLLSLLRPPPWSHVVAVQICAAGPISAPAGVSSVSCL